MDNDPELEQLRQKRMEELSMTINTTAPQQTVHDSPITVTDNDFDSIVGKQGTVLVDCWAPWCGPCRMLAPTLDKLAKKHAGKLTVAKLNTDENQGTAMRFQIMSIPTMLLFKDGKLMDRLVGALPMPMIEQKIDPHL